MNHEDREILWSALLAGLIVGGLACAIWLYFQIINQLDIQLS